MEIYSYKYIERRNRRIKRRIYTALFCGFLACSLYGAYRYLHTVEVVTSPAPVIATSTIATATPPKKYTQSEIEAWRKQRAEEVATKLSEQLSPEEVRVAVAIVKHESQLSPSATNWNCFYDSEGYVHETRVKGARSKACLKTHREYAWSVDCGIAQINFKGKTCPEHTKDMQWSVNKMVEMYRARGDWSAWVSYNTGAYLKYY